MKNLYALLTNEKTSCQAGGETIEAGTRIGAVFLGTLGAIPMALVGFASGVAGSITACILTCGDEPKSPLKLVQCCTVSCAHVSGDPAAVAGGAVGGTLSAIFWAPFACCKKKSCCAESVNHNLTYDQVPTCCP